MQLYGADQDILQTALQWLHDGHEVALVTVLKTWGSSPRPPGSLLVMRRDGVHTGSVSGGCVEEDLVQRYREQQLSDEFPVVIDYGVNRVEAANFGLPCGGRLELLVEKLNNISQLEELIKVIKHGIAARCVDLKTGRVTVEPGLDRASIGADFDVSDTLVRKVMGPRWSLLLIGAGHLSHVVSQMAQLLDYAVIVCDPREEYAQSWRVEGVEVSTQMPDEAVQTYAQHARSIVVALTHDPRLDDMALLDALDSPAFYVGAIGSRRNCEQRRQRLQQLGLSQAQLERLHAPVGLPIGSHTPAEIAVSILAEITGLRNAAKTSVLQSTPRSSAGLV